MVEIILLVAIVFFGAPFAAVGFLVFAFSHADVIVRMPEFYLNQRD